MQRIISFFLAFIAMFLTFFYGYNNKRVTDRLNPGAAEAEISSNKISMVAEGEVGEATDEITLLVTNHTSKTYWCLQEPDLEVLTDYGWFDVTKTTQVRAGEIKGTITPIGTTKLYVNGLNTFNILKGYTYRIVVVFETGEGDDVETVTAVATFKV